MTRKQFDEWAGKIAKMVVKSSRYEYNTFNNGTTIVLDTRTGKVGIARLHSDDDNYKFSTGVAIAYARVRGMEIPKIVTYKKLSEMQNGEMFYADRREKYQFIGKNHNENRYVVWKELSGDYLDYFSNNEYEMVD
jgi:hypothetical protein